MTDIQQILGDEAESLLSHQCQGIPKSMLEEEKEKKASN